MKTEDTDWKTKPTDRFILKWIKVNLSARITPSLLKYGWMRPWILTLLSSMVGTAAGVVFALGSGWLAGCVGAIAQVLDGVDGQFARLSGRQSPGGAFWDSVLDRYFDGAMVVGAVIYLVRLPSDIPAWLLLVVGSLALIGSSQISYSSSRAENLGIDTGRPTLASKGTRTAVLIVCAWGSSFWPEFPFAAISYLAIHTNLVVADRLIRSHRWDGEPEKVETGVIHGRFQVLHNDHVEYLLAGKERCRHLIVGITNPDPTLTRPDPADPERSGPFANPLTYYERYVVIREALGEEGLSPAEFSIVPFPVNFPELYGQYVPLEATFFLTIYDEWGRSKLDRFRELDLKTEVLWERPLEQKGLSASDIRLLMAEGRPWEHMLPPSTRMLMKKWDVPGRLKRLLEHEQKRGFQTP